MVTFNRDRLKVAGCILAGGQDLADHVTPRGDVYEISKTVFFLKPPTLYGSTFIRAPPRGPQTAVQPEPQRLYKTVQRSSAVRTPLTPTLYTSKMDQLAKAL